jgi:SWI/SNF-related matrix-associated actin-dependent regulator of chromatin subfamily A3
VFLRPEDTGFRIVRRVFIRRRGCVTPQILGQLATVQLDRVIGFDTLTYVQYCKLTSTLILFPCHRRDDQGKVRKAIISGRVDPADIPESAKLPAANQLVSITAIGLNQKKRKAAAAQAAAGSSSQAARPRMSQQITSSQSLRRLSQPAARQEMEEEEAEVNAYEEEPGDEIYCVLNSKIVGVQYYTGLCRCCIFHGWAY